MKTPTSTVTSLLLASFVLIGLSARASDIVFVTQPVSQNIAAGSNVTFSVSVTNLAPISFQWRFNGSGISGATNASFTITNAQGINGGAYNCVLSNTTGSVTSQVAQLVVFTKVWTGAGDGINWNNASNWSGGTLPGSSDDVLINMPGNVTVNNSGGLSIRSMVCQNNLLIGGIGNYIQVSGEAQVYGSLTVGQGTYVQASGADASFISYGPVSADGASFYASSGGYVSLPGLTNYNAGSVSTTRYLQSSGVGSVLSIPNLTSIYGPNNGYNLYIQASSGGQLNLSGVTNIVGTLPGTSANTQVSANGTNSIINLLQLITFSSPYGTSSITEQNGGIVLINNVAAINGTTYLLIGNVNLPNGAIGVAYSSTFIPQGGKSPFAWSLVTSNLPPGLSLSSSTGIISGTPATNGVYTFLVQVTDANNLSAEANVTLTITTPDSGFSATHAMPAYVSPGTNAFTCQISYPSNRQLYELYWQPNLPAGWTLLSASGDGSPEAINGQIVFEAASLPNPINITCIVSIPAGSTGTNIISGNVTYFMNGMNDVTNIYASPNPLLVPPAKRHSADYEDAPWVIDGLEASRVLGYWRAGAYHVSPGSVDGYGIGSGSTNGTLHSADFEVPIWSLDGTEMNRVLAYWRAGAYHPDTNGVDGYAPGPMVPTAAVPAPHALVSFNSPDLSYTETGPDLYSAGGSLQVTNAVTYNGTLLSLLWRPSLPAGWAVTAAFAPGNPEVRAGEIVWTGTLPSSPFQLVYTVQTAVGDHAAHQISTAVEYHKLGNANPNVAPSISSPSLALATVKIKSVRVIGNQVSLNVAGENGQQYNIQRSTDFVNWQIITNVTATNGTASIQDSFADQKAFYRAVLVQ